MVLEPVPGFESPLCLLHAAVGTLKSAALDLRPVASNSNRNGREVTDISLKRLGIFAVRDAEIKDDLVPTLDQSSQATQGRRANRAAIHSRPIVGRIASVENTWRKGVDEGVHGKA